MCILLSILILTLLVYIGMYIYVYMYRSNVLRIMIIIIHEIINRNSLSLLWHNCCNHNLIGLEMGGSLDYDGKVALVDIG